MKIAMDCLSCSVAHMLSQCRMSKADEIQTAKAMDRVLEIVSDYRNIPSPPLVAERIREAVTAITGNFDPYKEIKERDMATARNLMPAMEKMIANAPDPLLSALKSCAIGNTLDSALIENPDLENTMAMELERHFLTPAYDEFVSDLQVAGSLLLIGDNTGESILDTLLLKHLPRGIKKYYAVRSVPVINDVTYQDAVDSGIDRYAQIIESGSRAPGTPVDRCSKEFRSLFNSCDVVFSKGQGNFETMNEEKRRIYFLLKAKCQVICREIGCELGTYVLTRTDPGSPR